MCLYLYIYNTCLCICEYICACLLVHSSIFGLGIYAFEKIFVYVCACMCTYSCICVQECLCAYDCLCPFPLKKSALHFRQGSSETVLTLPVVSLYLPGPDEYRGVLARRYRRSARRQGEAARRARATMLARKGNRDLHKPRYGVVQSWVFARRLLSGFNEYSG